MSAKIKIVSAEKYLSLIKSIPGLVTLDCTWYPANKDGYKEYVKEHINGARYLPFTKIKTESPYPHMMPKNFSEFSSSVSKFGIRQTDYIVVYDQATYLSAPRAAWIFATFGHKDIYLLDNYQTYKRLGGSLASGETPLAQPVDYLGKGGREPSSVGNWLQYDGIVNIVKSGQVSTKYNVIDARPAGRFSGAIEEPRPEIQSGHIPGSKNIPFPDVVDGQGHFKSPTDMETLFKAKGLDPNKPSIVLCGSGVTACVVKTAIDNAFGQSAEIYDGSWSEWGKRAPAELIEKF